MKDIKEQITPKIVDNRKGLLEKEVMPSMAKINIFLKEVFTTKKLILKLHLGVVG